MFREKIFVSFYQDGSDKLIAACEIPTNQLPETFAINTHMHVGGQSFVVADARPREKKDFMQSGKLEVFLTEIQMMNPQEILYSLPTINDEITPYQKTGNIENVLMIAEDDVRQIEFIATKFIREINYELLAIRGVYDSAQEQSGFRTIHIRQQIKKPFDSIKLSLKIIQDIFGVDTNYRGVGYKNYCGIIPDSFAFTTKDNTTLWGEIDDDGNIQYLNILPGDDFSSSFCEKVDLFLAKNNLYLVDWVRLNIMGKERNSFRSF